MKVEIPVLPMTLDMYFHTEPTDCSSRLNASYLALPLASTKPVQTADDMMVVSGGAGWGMANHLQNSPDYN
jgi:hypothetical protein